MNNSIKNAIAANNHPKLPYLIGAGTDSVVGYCGYIDIALGDILEAEYYSSAQTINSGSKWKVIDLNASAIANGIDTDGYLYLNVSGGFGVKCKAVLMIGNLDARSQGLVPSASIDNSAILNKILSGAGSAPVVISGGTFVFNNIALQSGQTVIVRSAVCSPLANDAMFEMAQGGRVIGDGGAILRGSGKSSGNTLEVGVRISGDGECVVEGFDSIEDFGGDGVLVREHVNLHEGSRIQGFVAKNNKRGVTLENRGEYCIVTGLTVFGNDTGIICKGGNNKITNNTISDNVLGLHIQNGDNDAHGIIAINTINHNTTNLQIDLTNVDEMLLSDNTIYAGTIHLNGCVGVVFSGGIIESSAQILEDGCTEVVFDRVKFPGGINNTPNYNSTASLVLYKDPILARSESAVSQDSIGGSYSEYHRAGVKSISAGASDTEIFNSKQYNSVPANLQMTVEQVYDGISEWDPVSAVVERGFFINVLAQVSICRIGADMDYGNVHVLVVDSLNENLVLGVATPSPQIILSGDVRSHTYVFSGNLDRRAFKVKILNDSSDSVSLIPDQTDARCRSIVMNW